ncbi:MAG: MFS transporter [Rhodocyclaceae bacterium]|nr:MFS transporter [Rhodocyclaceae bacterium]
MSDPTALLRQRRFLPFFLTQFLGAFNDNLYKNALVVLITFEAARYTALSSGVLVNLAAGLFILPFFLFSATAGQLADKFDKGTLMRRIKALEIGIMALAAVAFALDSLGWMLVTLFLMGAQSALFGPAKYAILPQHLAADELVGGNALVEAGTFVAILVGTIAGGVAMALPGGPRWVAVATLAVALAGYLASRRIPPAPPPDASLRINFNPFTEIAATLRVVRAEPAVWRAVLAISWFWFYGALFLSQFPAYAKDVLGGDAHAVTLLLTVFSIGVGAGSMLCERLSRGRIELALVVLGGVGMSVFALDLWWAGTAAGARGSARAIGAVLAEGATWRALFDLLMIGVSGGVFIVPLYTQMQRRSAAVCRARVIAGNNILNALFMVVAAGMGAGLLAAGASVGELFLATALLNAGVVVTLTVAEPACTARLRAWLSRGKA